MRKFIVFAVALLLGAATAQDFVFGIVYDAGGKFDDSFNESTWRGLSEAVEELRQERDLEIDILEFEGTPETSAQGMRNIAEQGVELLVAPGFNQADSIEAVSREYPFTNFVLIDAVVEGDNVRSVIFKEHEGSFLVGYLAGLYSQTGVVGFVGGMDIPLIRNFETGYVQGVEAACPDCQVVSNYVGTTPDAWNDPARARELATVQNARGADIIYHAAGGSGRGVIDFANETMCFEPSGDLRDSPLQDVLADVPRPSAYDSRCDEGDVPIFFIGVDDNQNPQGDTDGDPETLNFGLSSMLKRVDVASANAAYDTVDDTFEAGVQNLGLAEEGVGYAVDEHNEALLTQEVRDELEEVRQRIIDGELEVQPYE